jgi:catechol 2,3-dioxygenase-like lactoylglutathione lyase family enzyme
MGANLEQSMHKSKLGGFIIDCRTDDLEAAAQFWSSALGMPIHELPGSENDTYRGLTDAQHGLDIEVQTVDHPSRVHLDIETDDIDPGSVSAWGARASRISPGGRTRGDEGRVVADVSQMYMT